METQNTSALMAVETVDFWWDRIQEKYGGRSRMELARWYLAKRAMGQKLGVV
ncbi:MAG: hypothetical protein GOV00_04320 [Candidatus Altiarchaeota archaeon]|nr:hypothetical protein [Candidatus Altiarchaeota archaeon]